MGRGYLMQNSMDYMYQSHRHSGRGKLLKVLLAIPAFFIIGAFALCTFYPPAGNFLKFSLYLFEISEPPSAASLIGEKTKPLALVKFAIPEKASVSELENFTVQTLKLSNKLLALKKKNHADLEQIADTKLPKNFKDEKPNNLKEIQEGFKQLKQQSGAFGVAVVNSVDLPKSGTPNKNGFNPSLLDAYVLVSTPLTQNKSFGTLFDDAKKNFEKYKNKAEKTNQKTKTKTAQKADVNIKSEMDFDIKLISGYPTLKLTDKKDKTKSFFATMFGPSSFLIATQEKSIKGVLERAFSGKESGNRKGFDKISNTFYAEVDVKLLVSKIKKQNPKLGMMTAMVPKGFNQLSLSINLDKSLSATLATHHDNPSSSAGFNGMIQGMTAGFLNDPKNSEILKQIGFSGFILKGNTIEATAKQSFQNMLSLASKEISGDVKKEKRREKLLAQLKKVKNSGSLSAIIMKDNDTRQLASLPGMNPLMGSDTKNTVMIPAEIKKSSPGSSMTPYFILSTESCHQSGANFQVYSKNNGGQKRFYNLKEVKRNAQASNSHLLNHNDNKMRVFVVGSPWQAESIGLILNSPGGQQDKSNYMLPPTCSFEHPVIVLGKLEQSI
jgi:hypothetical protein